MPSFSTSMATFLYPKPDGPFPYTSIVPTPLYPLAPPSISVEDGPALPFEAAQRISQDVAGTAILPGYRLSTHMFHAASPRTKCTIGPTPTFPSNLQNREEKVIAAAEHVGSRRGVNVRDGYEDGWPGQENALWVVVNRFVSEKVEKGMAKGNGITMVFMHATGFHKETWEATLKAVVRQYPEFSETVDELWLLDSVNHGDSALINEGKLGDIFNWHDNARDLLQFLLYYLPEKAGSVAPLHLKPLPEQISKRRKTSGFTNRRLIGVGHSVGGTSLCRAAIETPILFSDALLIDPVIYSPSFYNAIVGKEVPLATVIGRIADFSSREAALEYFTKIPFFKRWNRQSLQAYVDFAFTEDKVNGRIRLKMHSYQEAVVFAERRAAMETWELLTQLDPRIELRWIMNGTESRASGEDKKTESSPWRRDVTVWRREVNSSNIRIRGSGHLIAQTMPDELGREFGSYVLERYSQKGNIAARL